MLTLEGKIRSLGRAFTTWDTAIVNSLSFSPYLTSQEKALFEKRTVCCHAELSILLPIQR